MPNLAYSGSRPGVSLGAGPQDVPGGIAPALMELAVWEPVCSQPGIRIAVPAGAKKAQAWDLVSGPAARVQEAPELFAHVFFLTPAFHPSTGSQSVAEILEKTSQQGLKTTRS